MLPACFPISSHCFLCSRQATVAVIIPLEFEMKHNVRELNIQRGDVCVSQERRQLLTKAEIVLTCNECHILYSTTYAFKAKLNEEELRELVEIVKYKQRQISL